MTIAVIELLNDLDVVPDVFCFSGMAPGDVRETFNTDIDYRCNAFSDLGIQAFGALKGPLRNLLFRRVSDRYDVVFNADSYLLGLPDERKYVHYMLYPRKVELRHYPGPAHPLKKYLYTLPVSLLYRWERVHPSSTYLTLSGFSQRLLQDHYQIPQETEIRQIHPPVDLDTFWHEVGDRPRAISSVGSFDPSKNQLGQIRLASRMEDYTFYIMGSTVLNEKYFRRCQRLLQNLGLSNVVLLPDIPGAALRDRLVRSKYFLHTKVAEPFGIAAVEAAAAGCLPLVHNSGGQVETVPFPRLRFDRVGEIPDLIQALGSADYHSLLSDVRSHIKKYDRMIFKDKLRDLFTAIAGE